MANATDNFVFAILFVKRFAVLFVCFVFMERGQMAFFVQAYSCGKLNCEGDALGKQFLFLFYIN